jgi:dihydroflavonol-4-reductase
MTSETGAAAQVSVLVTGATGFLGGLLVRRLVADGMAPANLRCLVRDPRRARASGLPATTLVTGGLAAPNDAELAAAVAGVAIVVHLAGTLKGHRPADFDAVNVHGTERLCRAVLMHAPRAHVVLVSSLAAAGPSVDGTGSALPPAACRPVSLYGDSKRRGELALLGSALPATILRPPVVYGPGDAATRLLFRQACAPLCAVPRRSRPLSAIHAADVVVAIQLAMARRPVGAILPLDGPQRTDTHALLRAIAAAAGRRARLAPLPMAVAGAAAFASDLFGRLVGRTSYFNRDKVREIRADGWVADGTAAAAVLGFRPQVELTAGLMAVAVAEGFRRA